MMRESALKCLPLQFFMMGCPGPSAPAVSACPSTAATPVTSASLDCTGYSWSPRESFSVMFLCSVKYGNGLQSWKIIMTYNSKSLTQRFLLMLGKMCCQEKSPSMALGNFSSNLLDVLIILEI